MAVSQSGPFDDSCPFCGIAAMPEPPLNLILSTPSLLAFLDIQPLVSSAGAHILLIPRGHYPTIDTVPPAVAAELGRHLPLLVQALKAVLPEGQDAALNVLQNNGAGAGQVVHHTHFHIVPRSGGDKQTHFLASTLPKAMTGPVNDAEKKRTIDWSGVFEHRLSYAAQVYGRGQREDMDDEWAITFVPKLKQALTKIMAKL